MSITTYNGGSVVAMTGRNCVAIASDHRFGVQGLSVSRNVPKTFEVHDRLYLGISGLATDVQTLNEIMRFRSNTYKLQHDHDIEPQNYANLLSSTLYERRFGPFFVEPVVAGIDKNDAPFICSHDLIGCPNVSRDFAACGTSSESLFGMCETLWRPGMDEETLFEAISQALLNAVDRSCISGWGATVHIITPEKIVTRSLRARMD